MTGNRVARAGLHAVGGTGVQMAIQIISLVVLARLLEPAVFGVYGMAMTFIGFTGIFRDLGLSSAAIQAKELPVGTRSNLWWVNAGVGAALTALALALSPAIGAFFREPQVTFMVVLMAPTLLLTGAAVQYQASLARDLRFGVVAALDVTGAVVGLAASIALALAGGGVWALAVPQLVAGVITLVGAAVASRWLPGRPRAGQGTRRLLAFGASMFTSQVLTYAHRNYDALLMGRLHGAAWTGMFNRATQMSRMPIGMLAGPFGKVALATMSPRQDDVAGLGELARRGQVMLALPVLVVAGGLAAAAEPLVHLVLGPGWDEAVPFLRLIAVSEALALMASVGGWIMAARGLGRKLIRLGVISTVVKLTLISVGAAWGPYGIVAGVVASQLLLWPLSLILTGRMSGVSTRAALLDSFLLVSVVGGAAAAGWAAGEALTLPGGDLVHLLVVGLSMLGVLAAALAIPAFRRDVQAFAATVRSGIR